MVLNVKAALTICGLFVASLCYLVDQVALPVRGVEPLRVVTRAKIRENGSPVRPGVPLPLGEAPRFARSSPFEREQAGRPEAVRPLVAAAMPEAEPNRKVALPPLARPELAELPDAQAGRDEVVLASSTEAAGTGELMPLMALRPEPAEPAETDETQAKSPEPRRYTVRKGDSLIRIARREYGSSEPRFVELLLEANPKLRRRPDRVFVGEVLLLPPAGSQTPILAAGAKAAEGKPGVRPAVSEPPLRRWYTIRKNDSLASIARRYLSDVRRWREIAELNGLRNPHRIRPGMRIRLPVLASSQG